MKYNALFLVIGFVLGVLASANAWVNIAANNAIATAAKTRPNKPVSYPDSPCLELDQISITGTWQGSHQSRSWAIKFDQDGSYDAEFFAPHKSTAAGHKQQGLWSQSGCLMTLIHADKSNEGYVLSNVYRVHELTETKMTYSHTRDGSSFTSYKKQLE